MMIPSCTNSMADSAMFCTPVGTSARLRPATTKNAITSTAERNISRTTLLIAKLPSPQMVGHSTRWLTGGKSRANTLCVSSCGLQRGERERDGQVLGLPHEETEVGADDREAERQAADP